MGALLGLVPAMADGRRWRPSSVVNPMATDRLSVPLNPSSPSEAPPWGLVHPLSCPLLPSIIHQQLIPSDCDQYPVPFFALVPTPS